MYKCRVHECNKLANGNYSCCSQVCRNKVPNCKLCNNATEPGFYKGMNVWSTHCYVHGGRVAFDGDVDESWQRRPIPKKHAF